MQPRCVIASAARHGTQWRLWMMRGGCSCDAVIEVALVVDGGRVLRR